MKKTYKKPELTLHGSVEELTQVGIADVKKLGGFISLIGKSGKLFAGLSM